MEPVAEQVPGKRSRSKRKHRKSSAKRARRINKASAEAEIADLVNASKIEAAAREKGIQVEFHIELVLLTFKCTCEYFHGNMYLIYMFPICFARVVLRGLQESY